MDGLEPIKIIEAFQVRLRKDRERLPPVSGKSRIVAMLRARCIGKARGIAAELTPLIQPVPSY